MSPEELQSRLLYRDACVLVLDKPAGIAVHKGPKYRDNPDGDLEAYFDALRFGLPRPPALAHRLDRDTSGCLVLGRHRKALETLALLFKQGRIGKTYWAVVEGAPAAEAGLIDLALGRLDAKRGWRMKADPAGLPARTRWRVLGRGLASDGSPLAFLALEPLTGRTHQLRVHCAAAGWPILGDPVYGAGARGGAEGLQLHARTVTIPFSPQRDPIRVEAPAPAHMRAALAACA